MQADSYLGINDIYSSVYSKNSSKFLGFLFPVISRQEYNEKVKNYKVKYSDASHVCSACVMNIDRSYRHFNDDGEPVNSAGRPILNAILSSGLSFVGCVVIRYYGGKKLGITGLLESYGKAATISIEKSKFIQKLQKELITCSIDSAFEYHIYNFLSNNSIIIFVKNLDNKFELSVPRSMVSDVKMQLIKINTLVIED
jgi:putative IMPACT (imprinted ancient) family translation regulator